MKDKQPQVPSVCTLIVKSVAVLIIGYFLVGGLWFTVVSVSESESELSKTDGLNWCEEDYRKRNFADLYDTLTLYNLYDECYDVYWEAVNGYDVFVEYEQWKQAAGLGVDGAEQEAQSRYETLEKMAQNPEFSQNAKILNGFLDQANGN